MKYIFYIFAFLFLTVFAQAQQTIDYISFFPPAHVVQNEVTLKQNADSFDTYELDPNHFPDGANFHALKGGLVLGAADGANINIDTMKVYTSDENSNVAIKSFDVDNFIKVYSEYSGIVDGSMSIGEGSSKGSKFFLSAGKIKYILTPMPPILGYGLVMSKTYSSDLAVMGMIRTADPSWHGGYTCSNATSVYGNRPSNFIPGLQAGNKLVWCNLRINGHETCRPYLVKYIGKTAPCDLTDAMCRKKETNR